MKVIIAGSRSFCKEDHFKYLVERIDALNIKISEEICGMARGADTLGKMYAVLRHIPTKDFPADWEKYGKRAGHIRNEEMADYADMCIVFWDGESKGTLHMMKYAKSIGLPLIVYEYDTHRFDNW